MSKGLGAKHTVCRKGNEVVIKLLNGDKIVDVFLERKNGVLLLKNYGRIKKGEIRSFAVLKKRII